MMVMALGTQGVLAASMGVTNETTNTLDAPRYRYIDDDEEDEEEEDW